MKKLLMSVLFAVGCLAANAEDGWRETLGKVADLTGDTGVAGFVKRMAPAYLTGDFDEADRPEKKPLSANRNGYYGKDLAWHGGYFNDVVMAKIMNVFSKKENRVNPLIGSAGVSAVPMAARVSNKVALADDPTNFVLMQAMGPNVSGVIGSAVVAGILYTLCR